MQLAIGDVLEGKVTGITKFGAFVELPEGKTGMVHISEVSTAYVEDISQYLEENQVVKVKVINITDEGKISLSIKKALPREVRPQQPNQAARPANSGAPTTRGNNNSFNRNRSDGGSGRAGSSGGNGGSSRGGYGNRSGQRYEPRKPFNPQQMSSYEWSPRTKSEGGSFEDMMNKFKQTSDDKISDLKKSRGEVKRGSSNRKTKPTE